MSNAKVADERLVTVGDTAVRVMQQGSGPALVYLHGSGDLGTWLPIHDDLAAQFAVVRPDLPGFGGSDSLAAGATVHDVAEAIGKVIGALGLSAVIVMGSSLGGWVAADLAASQPALVQRLILIAPAGLEPDGGPIIDMFSADDDTIVDATFAAEPLRERARAQGRQRRRDPQLAAVDARARETTYALARDPYFYDPGLAARLSAVTAPTLIVYGEQDGLLPSSVAQKYANLIAGSSCVAYPACGHLPQLECRADFLMTVTSFLDRQ